MIPDYHTQYPRNTYRPRAHELHDADVREYLSEIDDPLRAARGIINGFKYSLALILLAIAAYGLGCWVARIWRG